MSRVDKTKVNVIDLADGLTPHDEATAVRCKFILVSQEQEVTLVFGRIAEYKYHANLLERFCWMHRIPSGWEHKPDIYALYEKGVNVRGGGYFIVDYCGRVLRIFGRSTAYGAYDEDRLRKVLAGSPHFSTWEIDWEGD